MFSLEINSKVTTQTQRQNIDHTHTSQPKGLKAFPFAFTMVTTALSNKVHRMVAGALGICTVIVAVVTNATTGFFVATSYPLLVQTTTREGVWMYSTPNWVPETHQYELLQGDINCAVSSDDGYTINGSVEDLSSGDAYSYFVTVLENEAVCIARQAFAVSSGTFRPVHVPRGVRMWRLWLLR